MVDFRIVFVLLPSTAVTFSKKPRPKNPLKPLVFAGFSDFCVGAHSSKSIEKSLPTRFSSESRHRTHSESDFSEFQSAKMTPEVPLGRLGRLPGAPLGPSWSPTWPSWRPLGGSLAASWPLLGGLGSLLATLVAPKTLKFACWVHFWMTSARLGLRLLSKS